MDNRGWQDWFKHNAFRCLGVILLLAAVVAMITINNRMTSDERDYWKEGNLLFQSGRFERAEAEYLKALANDPEQPDILEKLGKIALYRNDTAEAELYFSSSLAAMPWYRNVWPLNSNIHYQLGLAYLRQDRLLEAGKHFDRASGPITVGPFRTLDSLAEQYMHIGDRKPYSIIGPDFSQVEMAAVDPLPVVKVSINGSKPQNFILDTGGMEVILDDDLAQQVGVEVTGSIVGSYGGGLRAETGLGWIDSLTLGEYVIHNLPVQVIDTEAFGSMFNHLEITGVIGTRLLMHFITTIDYRGGALLLEQVSEANLENLEIRAGAKGVIKIPVWLLDTHYLVAWGSLHDLAPTLFFIDTGLAGIAFTAPVSVLEEAGIEIDWSRADTGVGGGGEIEAVPVQIDRLTLGRGGTELTKMDLSGVASEKPPEVLGDQLGVYLGGLVSHQFFRETAVTLDYTGMRLIVAE